MNYRLTCLTPTLVGDGDRLSPIDYMVWKDQVNVLDQRRIFRLLAKGPRLEGYLTQLKRADKLDFASWGGFAQNFAGRRIPFEHPSMTPIWERARGDSLFIPTFMTGTSGAYLPGSAIKGALRTGMVFARWTNGMLRDVASRMQGERAPRRPAEAPEEHVIGGPGSARTKAFAVADSAPIPVASMKVYLLRVSTLVDRGGRFELGWKQSPRGTVDGRRVDDSTPVFAEMANPGTAFTGVWDERAFYERPETARSLNWREPPSRAALFEAVNQYAAKLLAGQKEYAERAGLAALANNIAALDRALDDARQLGNACLLPLGWGGGMLTKSAWLDTANDSYRQVLREVSLYARAIQSGMPFPKTRRIVFQANQPATLPGWCRLDVLS